MRNLITLNKGKLHPLASTVPEEEASSFKLVDSTFDVITDSITVVLFDDHSQIYEIQQYMKDGTKLILATFSATNLDDTLLSFAHFPDLNQLIFVFKLGDILTATYDSVNYNYQDTVIEIVGSIDDGIAAASWSYDEETLVLVTNANNVVLLSKNFDPINEYHMELDDLKMSKHVTVGWGKKETQFRGTGAKAMEREAFASLKASGLVGSELRDPTMPYMVDTGKITELDNKNAYISWRGDCEYFVVSTVDAAVSEETDQSVERRVLRVFTREGELDSASEPVDGMERHTSWKPQGSLIASIQRRMHSADDNSLDLIFFERNGLRHGEFDTRLPLNEQVNSLTWNNTSDILTIVLQDRIQLWTTKNYHWYLKQEIYSENINFAKWHPEKDFTLLFGNENEVNILDFAYKTTVGPTLEPFDNGTTLVIDCTTVNITPLAMANVPPPIYFRDFETPENVIDVATSLSNEIYAAINRNALVLASVVSMGDMKKGQHPQTRCILPKTDFASEFDTLRQVAFVKDSVVAILLDSDNLSRIVLINVENIDSPTVMNVVETFDKIILLKTSFDYNFFVYETRDGSIMQLDLEGQFTPITKFPQLVRDFRVIRVDNQHSTLEYEDDVLNKWNSQHPELVAFGITNTGKLFANDVQLTNAVTSLEVTNSFLLFTTVQNNLQFVHLNSTQFKPLPIVEEGVIDERVRAIERGSILVNSMPTKGAVVLQAPRGNLETICPRIMVLASVRKSIKEKNYKVAFTACRTHRIHLDILHDYDPELFYENLKLFIDQIEKVSYLDLFISCLVDEDVSKTKYKETLNIDISEPYEMEAAELTEMQLYLKKKFYDPSKSKINKICKAILKVLLNDSHYKKKYIQSIITAYSSQKPSNVEGALSLITALNDKEEKESCLTYLCFLQDINVLYKEALALYDVKLSLAVAQKSQMDPREYLPFLQNLFDNEPLRRRFLIDDYLKNYEKALEALVESSKDETNVNQEIQEYVDTHCLYKNALDIYRHDTSKQNVIYRSFARHLSSKQEYSEAAMIFEMLGQYKEAMEAYIFSKRWQEALSIATDKFPDQIISVADDLVSTLTFEHKYVDAAEIYLKFLDNIEEAISCYCRSYNYATACLTASSNKMPDLIEKIIDPGLGEGYGTVAELLADCKGQINSQLRRLKELRTKKEEDPYAFYGQETEQADDVSIAPSETSTKDSFFTRYTGKTGGTAKTGVSRRTSKNKRREERKRARGKKGTIYEEEYLVKSIGRLIERLDQTRPDAAKLIDGLCRRNKREQAYQIQKTFIEVLDLLKDNVEEIYTISEKDRERINENGEIYYIPEIPVPEIKDFEKNKIVDY
ncbi:hypothetical protein TBLA_0I02920 [Henningerozyma blattae CBS 6284]|uniref:Elongator complex protein 1 n=1 Tax=Henningerozyma blattae (strain ATCC 34711 / CBS 6284 / DSM 70876 / NBRC 10599 / NRRL Y-10934 / UCD 77-7) TaxID=1071380 RepID=I2H996_HENB6|nr:hypothetical protein TBLA_0I02920 [Tetrapisispora blattae CBS 6284]CCH62948.1 hypothetical protein TBLA_0I02920 [Tetrapisispora blattae CBS 6284]